MSLMSSLRGRAGAKAIVPFGAAAALVGGLVMAGPANAATPTPTLTNNAPAQVENTGSDASLLTLKVNNPDTSNATG